MELAQEPATPASPGSLLQMMPGGLQSLGSQRAGRDSAWASESLSVHSLPLACIGLPPSRGKKNREPPFPLPRYTEWQANWVLPPSKLSVQHAEGNFGIMEEGSKASAFLTWLSGSLCCSGRVNSTLYPKNGRNNAAPSPKTVAMMTREQMLKCLAQETSTHITSFLCAGYIWEIATDLSRRLF